LTRVIKSVYQYNKGDRSTSGNCVPFTSNADAPFIG